MRTKLWLFFFKILLLLLLLELCFDSLIVYGRSSSKKILFTRDKKPIRGSSSSSSFNRSPSSRMFGFIKYRRAISTSTLRNNRYQLSPPEIKGKSLFPIAKKVLCYSSLSDDIKSLVRDKDGDLYKNFDYVNIEKPLYSWWETSGYFKPKQPIDTISSSTTTVTEDRKKQKPFVMAMPPPNVTGQLHLGHAIGLTIQDIMARFHRMRGKPTLWFPGTDHAGIATQMLVEREIMATEGLTKSDIGRKAFLERAWKWKSEKSGHITKQMRRIGASADWSRERFTLDDDMSIAVTEAFVRLYEKGKIYKGNYMVNWVPELGTAVSDLEVEYKEIPDGKLFYFKYMLEEEEEDSLSSTNDKEQGGFIPVSTTRPETILGDTAVCINPDDERYSHLIGKNVIVPITNRLIPIIADSYVDIEFGTGALKITPGHDINDYEIGQRHNLPIINIMHPNGTIIESEYTGKYAKLDRFECRDQIWDDMSELGLSIKIEKHAQRIPISQRGGDIIEPRLSSQWFVKMDQMGENAFHAVEDGRINILPGKFEKSWYNWLGNIHDWCISRQLWWGHRIPVWYLVGNSDIFFVARSEEDAYAQAKSKLNLNDIELEQDEDVLDTWFSSGLYPFSALGWPNEKSSDFQNYYPGTLLETGYDILFFWVARMVMLGQELTGKEPFSIIYMHGLIRDGENVKMSKTKGNVVDPIETINKYGADPLRFSLVTGTSPGLDIPLSMEKIDANRNFMNKIWNTARYVIRTIEGLDLKVPPTDIIEYEKAITKDELAHFELPERYIISRCHEVIENVTDYLEKNKIAEAGDLLYHFLWDEFADWYIEASKTRFWSKEDTKLKIQTCQTLCYVMDRFLRMMHPFMPYITETIWQELPKKNEKGDKEQALIAAAWPQDKLYKDVESIIIFNKIQTLVKSIRNARAEYGVPFGKRIPAILKIEDKELADQFKTESDLISWLARLNDADVKFDSTVTPRNDMMHVVASDGIEVFLPLSDLVDKVKELERLSKQEKKLQSEIDILRKRLSNVKFLANAPEKIISELKNNLKEKSEIILLIDESKKKLNDF